MNRSYLLFCFGLVDAFIKSHNGAPFSILKASQLEQLSEMTVLSIDSGDLDTIAKWAETGFINDATTNPLFVANAGTSGDLRYIAFVDKAIAFAKEHEDLLFDDEDITSLAMERLAVELGLEIIQLIPGYVSTEVDIRYSFDTFETVRRARRIIAMYEASGVSRNRILVKIAGTFEGIEAARILQAEDNIECNITLVFGFIQAVFAAQNKVRLISPFPGRILDWHKAHEKKDAYEPDNDPGVVQVIRMFQYYKRYGYQYTICMPASWRPSRGLNNPEFALDEIRALAGVDRMTIPQPLIEQLDASMEPLPQILKEDDVSFTIPHDPKLPPLDASQFRLLLNQDLCTTTKLAEGINSFYAETLKLQAAIEAKILQH